MVFHFDISGSDINDEQFKNISAIIVTLSVFHLEISGNDINFEQLENIPPILSVYLYSI